MRAAGDAHDPDHRLVGHAVVEEGFVAGLHRFQVEPRGVVAHPVPFGAAVTHQIGPAVALGLGFHQPAAHRKRLLLGQIHSMPDRAPHSSGEPSRKCFGGARKLNNLKGFRIPSRVTNGSSLGGLALVNASHI